jgi:hypothetical protein
MVARLAADFFLLFLPLLHLLHSARSSALDVRGPSGLRRCVQSVLCRLVAVR